ncbi:methyltransferase [Actinosynnema sp. NPDC023587]|uniref:methyltransferase n=1 Tax=Actinosynnema sp. NPDC023587 TaxID=3154695 RepID=UPI0033FC0B74
MYNELGYELGSWTLARIEDPDSPLQTSFSLLGMDWDLLPEVFPPYTDPGPGLFASWVPYRAGERFLEMGCGAGVASVLAAQRGCSPVVAVDINPAAAENAARNAARHGVADRVRALTSDLFEALDDNDLFDVVFWNSPFIEAPEDRAYAKQIERAVMDPGYGLQRRFFQDAGAHLAEGGRIHLGTSEAMGNPEKMLKAAADAGFQGRKFRSEAVALPAADFDQTPVVKANTDEHGMMAMDFTMYEFLRS